jgi:hypothetical protein
LTQNFTRIASLAQPSADVVVPQSVCVVLDCRCCLFEAVCFAAVEHGDRGGHIAAADCHILGRWACQCHTAAVGRSAVGETTRAAVIAPGDVRF